MTIRRITIFCRRVFRVPQLTIVASLCCGLADAATLSGTVRDSDGRPLVGAMVTLKRGDGLLVETVYTGRDGRYRLRTAQSGSANLRARSPNYADDARDVDVDRAPRQSFTLAPLPDITARSERLPASAHFARLRFDSPAERDWFQAECLSCHQIGNAFTRMPRPIERWRQITERMLGFFGIRDAVRGERYAQVLHAAFDGSPIDGHRDYRPDPRTLRARIVQWKLPTGVIAHDAELYPADGRFYTVDQGTDQILITDPRTATTEVFDIPTGGIPQGGKFLALLGDREPLGLRVARGPHSLQEGPNGNFYTTDTVSGQIGEFDPRTRSYVGHEIGGNSLYPHTLRFDRQGRVWFTISFTNQVGVLDTRNGAMRVIELPPDTDRPTVPALVPYGIDVNPVDGSVWYSSLLANRIGRIDPVTFAVESFTPPTIGPRRMRFAADGTLWIPDFGRGRLVRLDTRKMKYESFDLPAPGPGEVEAPYALGVHPRTQEVWITANMSDRIFRFYPRERRFVSYLLPTQGIYLRDVVFTPEGMVCAASSPMPAAVTVEGGMQEVMCLDPEGDLPLPAPAAARRRAQ